MFVYRHPTIAAGGLLLTIIVAIAIFAPMLGTVDPTALAPARRTRAPNAQYWFGTDMLGRDVYSRVLYGARVSLIVGFSVGVDDNVVDVDGAELVLLLEEEVHGPLECGGGVAEAKRHDAELE